VDTDLKSRRIDVLLRWRASIEDGAGPVPSEADLTKVGAAGTVWPPYVDRGTLDPWEATVRYLLEQVALGAADPVTRIPPHLRTPKGGRARSGPGTPAGDPPGGGGESVLDRVRRWREQAVNAGVPGASELKPSMLRSLVSRGLRTADDIAGGLPPSLAHLAPAIAAAMRGETGGRPGRHASAEPADADAGRRPVPERPGSDAAAESEPDIGGPTIDAQLKGLRFVAFRHHAVPRAAQRVTVEPTPTGGVALRWPAAAPDDRDGPPAVVIYRVVSDDHAQPMSPDEEDADLIAVTCGSTATDDRPFERAVRHFAVWSHTGPTAAEAAAAQPVPHAEGWHVVPPRDVELHYDHPRVVGGWHRLDGTDMVQVVRSLRRGGRPAPRDETWDGYEEVEDGFKDTRPVPGSDYDYWIRTGVLVDGSHQLSDPVRCRIQIPAAHEPVRDLKLDQHVDDENRPSATAFDLSWTPPPAGLVRIYRTEQPPAGGLVGEAIAEAALPQAGLHPNDRLGDRPGLVGGRAVLRAVPWPERTHRAYFTPVTLLGGRARVGPTLSESRLGEIAEARIVERIREQVITFEWPPGATSVWLHRRVGKDRRERDPAERVIAQELGPADREISLDEYERLGGVRVQLDQRGERVRLVPVLWEEGAQARQGAPLTLEYRGLVRLWYSVAMVRLDGGRVAVSLRVFGHPEDGAPPRFALVHHRHRLPLSWRDDSDTTRLVLSDPVNPDTSWLIQPTTLHPRSSPVWATEVPPTGFIRLCIAEPVGELARYALHDPPVTTLQPGLATAARSATGAPPPQASRPNSRRPWWRR
jgi:hypothetical protein